MARGGGASQTPDEPAARVVGKWVLEEAGEGRSPI
jgi:hypothetical protein